MKTTIIAAAIVLLTATTTNADTFGTDPNTMFEIEFVTIGNPGNADDTTGLPDPAGKVGYGYRIGKYEVSEGMVNKANASGGMGIAHNGYGVDKPAGLLTWFEAATFINWLNTDSGNPPAYNFDGTGKFQLWQSSDAGYNPNNPYRNRLAKYVLPSMDEWYKAAYYDPDAGVYYDYPTGSNTTPDGINFPGDPIFDAVFFAGSGNLRPNDITDVGVLSPYGTAAQGGNIYEWEETDYDLVNESNGGTFLPSAYKGLRGGGWGHNWTALLSTNRLNSVWPGDQNIWSGFRVASVPEPTSPSRTLLGNEQTAGFLSWQASVGGLRNSDFGFRNADP